MKDSARQGVTTKVGQAILSNQKHPLVVGISGIDGSGKPHFTNELTDWLKNTGRKVNSASIELTGVYLSSNSKVGYLVGGFIWK